MRDTATIVEQLVEEGATLVLEYGSSVHDPDTANDVDLFAMYEADATRTANIRLGNFEVLRLTKPMFRLYRRVLNPVHCTEPVLKGVVKHGSESAFEAVRADIEERSPTTEAVRHNIQRSYSEYCKAVQAFEAGDLDCACTSLSFAVSYRLFARWYSNGNKPDRLDRLIQETEASLPITEVFDALEDVKQGQTVSEDRVADLFDCWNQAAVRA